MASSDYLNKFGEITSKVGAYNTDTGKQKDDLYNKLRTDFGYDDRVKNLDATRKSVMDAESLLTNLPTNIKQRTSGRLMTAGQTARLQAREQDPLVNQLTNLNRSQDVEGNAVKDINSNISDQLQNFLQTRGLGLDSLMNEQSNTWNQYKATNDEERNAWQQDFQNKQLAQQAYLAQLQSDSQNRIAEIQDKYNRDVMSKQDAKDQQAYNQYLQDEKAKKTSDLHSASTSYIQTSPTKMNVLDYIGLGLNVKGSKNKLKSWENKEDDKNQYAAAVKFIQNNYGKNDAATVKKSLQTTNNPYAYLVDQYY